MDGLRQRLLRWLLFPLLAFFCAGIVADYYLALKPASDAYDDSLGNTAVAIASLIQHDQGRPVLQLLPRTEAVLRTDRFDRIHFAVYDEHGSFVGGDRELAFVGFSSEISFHDIQHAGNPARLIALPYLTESGMLLIEVSETINKRERQANNVMVAVSSISLGMVLVTLVLVSYGVNAALKPLEHLRKHIAARPPRDLAPLPSDDVPLELQPLIATLNRQFALLSESIASQERFLSDAAHQLKTPLAALQGQLDLAASDPDPASRQRRLSEMMEATRRVTHLSHQLLALARATPSAGMQAQRQSVRLPDIAERIAESHLDTAIARNVDLGFELDEAEIPGIPWLLRELLANLVDNALTYVASGDKVTVRCGLREGTPFLEVEDNGPGIPVGQREQVFERFYRPPGSEGDGCGLGLSIVREIAASHGACVSINDAPGGGAILTVLFQSNRADV